MARCSKITSTVAGRRFVQLEDGIKKFLNASAGNDLGTATTQQVFVTGRQCMYPNLGSEAELWHDHNSIA